MGSSVTMSIQQNFADDTDNAARKENPKQMSECTQA